MIKNNYPILLPQDGWYKIIDFDKSLVKTIFVVDSYQNNRCLSWDISNNKDKSITAYLLNKGKVIIIAGNGSGKILANQSMKNMFSNFTSLKEIKGLGNILDTSNTIDMSYLFHNCISLYNIENLEKLNTSNVINFEGMFLGCGKIKKIDFSSLDTSNNSSNTSKIFTGCNNLKRLKTGINFNNNLTKEENHTILKRLDEVGYVVISPKTGSMQPLLRPTIDHVVFKKQDSYKKNDIVVYEKENEKQLIMHRIERKFDNGYLIKGDNSRYAEFVPCERIYAGVTEIYKNNKTIKRNSLSYKFSSFYSINYNNLLYTYRSSNNLVWKVARKVKRTLFNKKVKEKV